MYNNDSILQEERYNISCSYALLGETELAFTLLEDMLKDGYTDYNHLRRDVDFTPIQGERFDSLINHYDALTQERIRAYHGDVTDTIQQERVVEVPFTAANGVTKVDCTINKLPLKFVFDTGASDVTISQVEANFMIKNGYLSEKDIIGKQHYQTADGDISVGTTILLKEVQFAGLILRDVRASVVQSQQAPLLLGQSVLKRLGKIEIDNAYRVLKITTNQ
jgi:clan AA aspartic protease (TIGR02281 family)